MKVRGHVGNRHKDRDVEFVNIDNPQWTMKYESDRENSSNEQLQQIGQDCVQRDDGGYDCINTYAIYRDFSGFTWIVPHTDFSSRTILPRVRNASDYTLRLQGATFSRLMGPHSEFDVAGGPHPGGEWMGTYPTLEIRQIGLQRGETKEGRFFMVNPRTADLQFHIRCSPTPTG